MKKLLKNKIIITAFVLLIVIVITTIASIRVQYTMNYKPESLADFTWQAWCMDERGEVSNQNVSEVPLGDYVVRSMEISEEYGDFLITTIGVESLFGKYFVFTT